jgi:integrase/recombinase XerD
MNRDSLYRVLQEISIRVGVKDVYPHRFRHSFTITYLRNGGDIHRKASPADNWRL